MDDFSEEETRLLKAEMAAWGEEFEKKRFAWRISGGTIAIILSVVIPIFIAGVILYV